MPAITSKQINDVVAAQRAAKRRRIAGEMHRVHQAAQGAVEKDTQQPVEPDNIDLQALLALLAPYTVKP